MSNYGVGLRNGVAFALGTIPSLTSGGTLRPSLLLDFLSGSLDSRITFSRGTQAMQYGSDGTLQYAPNNLLTYSNQADNAAWTKSNSFVQQNLIIQSQAFDSAAWSKTTATVVADTTTAPDGTLTADTVTATTVGLNTGFLAQTVTFAASTSYAYSIYVKHGTESSVQLQAICTVGATNSGCVVSFNVTSGSVSTVFNYGSISGATASITPAANGFYRCTLVIPVPAGVITSGAVWFFPYSGSDAAGTYAYAWGAQLVQGSVPGDYRATTSAALPVLYADYNGALRARKLCEAATTSAHFVSQSVTVTGSSNFTDSIYVKAGERTSCRVINYDAGANYAFIYVDLNNGNILTSGVIGTGSGQSFTVTSVGNGWYRIAVSVSLAATTRQLRIDTALAGNEVYAGDGSSGIYIADAQLTPGYLPLAVTETTSAAVYGPRFDYDPSSLVTQNLLLYSQAFENAVWGGFDSSHVVAANSVVAPDGTLTADAWTWPTSTTNYGFNAQNISGDASQAYTYSVWARLQTGAKNMRLKISNVSVATSTSANIGLTTTWQRISYSIAAGALSNTGTIGVAFEQGTTNTVAAGDIIELFGAQLNRGATALPYTATTTAPYTLTTARGLLIEEQRVNLFTYSNDFTNVIWNNANVTVTPASTTSPEGVLNMSKLAATAGAATSLYQSAIVAATSASGSIYVKQGTGATTANAFVLRNVTTALDLVGGTLNYSTGVWTYSTGSTGVVVRNIGNGIWRVEISASAGITAGDTIRLYTGFAGGAATAGDFLYAYGAQLEAGAFATSYIPTVASTATRNADSASITTLTPWFNAAAGTFYASWDYIGAGSATNPNIRPALNISDGTSNNRIQIYNISGNDGAFIATGGVTQAALDMGSASAPNVIIKGAVSFATNDAIFARNGVLSAADTSVTLPTVTTLYIGAENNTNRLNGHLQSMRYYPTRLPNASLQSITA